MLSSGETDTESIVPIYTNEQIEVLCMRFENIVKKYYVKTLLIVTFQTIFASLVFKYS
jgi:hypothetical protein